MKVLIFSAATGGGHNRASNALKSYIMSQDDTNIVEIVDVLEQCSSMLNKTVTIGYKTLAKNMPELFGALYKSTDKESSFSSIVGSLMSQFAKKLIPLINEMNPDIVISCHPFASGMMSIVKESHGVTVPVISIITDYMPHRAYIGNHIDAYITASPETAENLAEKYSVDKDRIYAYGMPIFQSFYNCDKAKSRETLDRLGFSHKKPTVLVMAGSFGVTTILKIYERLVDIDIDYQLIVITGKNKKLYEAFEKMLDKEIEEFETDTLTDIVPEQPDTNVFRAIYDKSENMTKELGSLLTKTFKRSTNKTKPTKLFYFVDNVEDYMHASDLIITKPGGLTTSESLACGLPMAVFKAYPGQESQNADFLVSKEAAIKLEKGDAMKEQIAELLNNKEKLNAMKLNSKNCAPTNASENIYKLAQSIVEQNKTKTQ